MLKAVHAREDREAPGAKVKMAIGKLKQIKLEKAAALVTGGAEEPFSYCGLFPAHWRSTRPNNPPERISREIRRRTGTAENFPDAQSALMVVARG